MLKKLRQSNQGFTIIEVLIVLAIAALILLIVFLAVPALQRNSRNNSRKNDASRTATAIANFASNNNGSLPSTATTGTGTLWATDCGTLIKDVGSYGEFSNATGFCSNTAPAATGNITIPANAFEVTTGARTFVDTNNDGMVYDNGAVCPTTTGASTATTPGTNRQAALLYDQEVSGNTWNVGCIQAT